MFFWIGVGIALAVFALLMLMSGGGGFMIALGVPALIITIGVLWWAMRGHVRH